MTCCPPLVTPPPAASRLHRVAFIIHKQTCNEISTVTFNQLQSNLLSVQLVIMDKK